MTNPKIPLKKKIGYAFGAAEIAPYNLFYIFYLFFLTDVAQIPPAVAGVIPLIAILWDAVTDPWIGMFSDNLRSRFGRRRPVMLASILPFTIAVYCMWSTPDFGVVGKSIYFILASMIYWASATGWHIPHFSLGAEMTQDYHERTTLQSFRTAVQTGTGMIAGSTPLLVVAYFANRSGGDLQHGWSMTGLIFAVFTGLLMFLSWGMTRNTENPIYTSPSEYRGSETIFRRLGDAMKIKSFRLIMMTWFLCIFANSLSGGSIIYYLKYYLKLKPDQLSVFVLFATMGIVWTPIIKKIADKIEKKQVFILFIGAGCMINNIGLLLLKPDSPIYLGYMLAFLFAGGNAAFWTMIWSMCFDITEIDELKSGRRREGLFVGVLSFFQKVAAAICLSLGGIILSIFGYVANAPEQTKSALLGIKLNVAIIPLITFALSILCISAYPLTKRRFNLLLDALKDKNTKDIIDKEILRGL